MRVGGKIQEIKEIKIQRDLFESMLKILIDYNVDIVKNLSYSITSVPFLICHLDGTMCKIDKSTLSKRLEKKFQHEPPSHIDVLIIEIFSSTSYYEK